MYQKEVTMQSLNFSFLYITRSRRLKDISKALSILDRAKTFKLF